MERCAHSEQLAQYEDAQAEEERRFDNFIEACLAEDIVAKYEESKALFTTLAENYGFDDYSYEEFISEQ